MRISHDTFVRGGKKRLRGWEKLNLSTIPNLAEVNSVISVDSRAQCRHAAVVDQKIIYAINHFEERASIRVHYGGQPRTEAERAALIEAALAAGVDVVDLRSAIISRRK